MFVHEDTTRAAPDDLRQLYHHGHRAGPPGLRATGGAARLPTAFATSSFSREVGTRPARDVKVAWHCHKTAGSR